MLNQTELTIANLEILSFTNATSSEGKHSGEPPTVETNVIISVIIGLFLVVGASGSLLTAVVIGKTKDLHTKANFFIFSLCISDTISALVCSPFWTYRRTWGFDVWEWGDFTCKFYWVTDFSTNYVTSLHIVSFSILRFAAVKWPFKVAKISKAAVLLYICSLWIVAVISALPLGYLMGVNKARKNASVGSCWPSCSIAEEDLCCIPQYHTYISIINPLLFYLPDFVIIVFSILIAYEIRKTQKWRNRYFSSARTARSPKGKQRNGNPQGQKNIPEVIANKHVERVASCNTVSICDEVVSNSDMNHDTIKYPTYQTNHSSLHRSETAGREANAFLQLFLIVLGYAIGYIPATVYLQWSTSTPKEDKGHAVDYWFGVLSYLFLRFSECMNPLLYNLGSSNIRRESKKTIKRLLFRK